jgi:hypothetical protein
MDMGELWHWLLFAVAAALGLAAAVGAIRAALGVPTTREKLEQARIAATQAIAVEQACTVHPLPPQSITYSPNNVLHWAPAPRVTGGTQQQADQNRSFDHGLVLDHWEITKTATLRFIAAMFILPRERVVGE